MCCDTANDYLNAISTQVEIVKEWATRATTGTLKPLQQTTESAQVLLAPSMFTAVNKTYRKQN